MNKERLIEIGQKIIYTAGVYSKIKDEKKKKDLLNLFDKFEKELKEDNSKYSNTLLGFIDDLKEDINMGRELEIDSSMADDYLSNYFTSIREVKYYNLLIDEEIYRKIFEELDKKQIDKNSLKENILKLKYSFYKNIKKLSTENIAKNLLIITLENRNLVLPILNKLKYFLDFYELYDDSKTVNNMIYDFRQFLQDIKSIGLDFLQKNDFNYKYLKYGKTNNKLRMDIYVSDASKDFFRSGKPRFEYLLLLKKI